MSDWPKRLAVFDLETTGVDVDQARIVTACVALLDDNGTVSEKTLWLANPGVPIPESATAIHGITTSRAASEGRDAATVVTEIRNTLGALFAQNTPVVIYNAPYDLSLLARECRRHNLPPLNNPKPVIDPLVIDKQLDRYRKGKRTLEAVAAHYRVQLSGAHDALADAVAAGHIAQALFAAYPKELNLDLAELHSKQASWFAEQAKNFQDYLRNKKGDTTFTAQTEWPVRAGR